MAQVHKGFGARKVIRAEHRRVKRLARQTKSIVMQATRVELTDDSIFVVVPGELLVASPQQVRVYESALMHRWLEWNLKGRPLVLPPGTTFGVIEQIETVRPLFGDASHG